MSKGQQQHGLAAARAELIARDGALGDADRALSGVVSAAVTQATDAIRRIEAVQAEIESAICDCTPLENRERARQLLDRQRDVISIISGARANASTKAIELQHIRELYLSRQR
ncbi:MAG: DUF4226 domain-containing protein [Mycobacterium sp.]